jgi:hypothetical protein
MPTRGLPLTKRVETDGRSSRSRGVGQPARTCRSRTEAFRPIVPSDRDQRSHRSFQDLSAPRKRRKRSAKRGVQTDRKSDLWPRIDAGAVRASARTPQRMARGGPRPESGRTRAQALHRCSRGARVRGSPICRGDEALAAVGARMGRHGRGSRRGPQREPGLEPRARLRSAEATCALSFSNMAGIDLRCAMRWRKLGTKIFGTACIS